MLKNIFEKIKDREWDWFELKGRFGSRESIYIMDDYIEFSGCKCVECEIDNVIKSLPDLLANPSWCKAVWGEYETCDQCGELMNSENCFCKKYGSSDYGPRWVIHSASAFETLQLKGPEDCLKEIEETMI